MTENSILDWVLRTPRLDLRPLQPGDVEALEAVLGDPWTMRYYPAPFDRFKVSDWIARNSERVLERMGLYAMVLRSSGELIGDCGPVPQDLPNGKTETELGWHVRRDRQGRGYATEAASAWMGEMFGRGEAHLIALVRPENRPSCRVAEKIGMHIEEDILWNAELKWPHHVYGVSNPNR